MDRGFDPFLKQLNGDFTMTAGKKIKWKDTLNLPRTEFPMKANLSEKEPRILEKWESEHIYQKILEQRKEADRYTLHDGPPYANGHIHLGHAVNKILKDFIVKSKSMEGFYTPYVPGWDCHGLPIEIKVDQQLGSKKRDLSTAQIREKCRDYAQKFIGIQREEFKRLGGLGEWENPYTTLDHHYESAVLEYFKSFVSNGNISRSKRPVHWCASCQTALAEAEVEYQDKLSPSITVKFPLVRPPELLREYADRPIHILIWTTTPWTIPANLAIAVHPDFEYALFSVNDGYYICAARLIPVIAGLLKGPYRILKKFPGRELNGLKTRHPLFLERESLVILTRYVTLEQGTGCVHTAPGHGEEDYQAGIEYNLDIYSPVDAAGRFDDTAGKYRGLKIFEANDQITRDLQENGFLVDKEDTSHSYPHCWRCKKPVIFRATEQWFIDIGFGGLREKALEAIRRITWLPRWGEERIYTMVRERPRWCISRQRDWGVPIPVLYCEKCNEPLLTEASVEKIRSVFAQHGSDSWYTREVSDFLLPDARCKKCGHQVFVRGRDILDVWFESGASYSILFQYPGHHFPADMYIEGGDQYRGWFQSSLLVAINARDQAPYKTVITHGWTLDKDGKAMSKSMGNTIRPQEIIQTHGAEILRLWVAMVNYREDMRLSREIIERVIETYRKIRNTWRFMLGVLPDFDPVADAAPETELSEIDRFLLGRLEQVKEKILNAYRDYGYHAVFHTVSNFFTGELSAFYLNFTKDTLYCESPGHPGRRAVQTVVFKVLKDTLLLLAPILSFTCEEAWQYVPAFTGKEDSVHIHRFPEVEKGRARSLDTGRWDRFFALREAIQRELEVAIKEKSIIKDNLQAGVRLEVSEEDHAFAEKHRSWLEKTLSVPCLTVEKADRMTIRIEAFTGQKCPRCWNLFQSDSADQELCDRCQQVTGEMKLEQT